MILSVCPNPSVDTLVTVSDFSPGGVHRAIKEEHSPGGKGVHVALAARELGCEAQLLGFWAGPTGEWIRDRCAKQGIACHGPCVEGWSRSCMTLRAPSPYNETELLGPGPQVCDDHVRELRRQFERLVLSASVVTLSGSWPGGAPESGYADLIASVDHKPTILDCTGPALTVALRQHPFAVHLNSEEAASAFGADDPVRAVACLSEQCKVAVVTVGVRGAYFAGEGRILHAICPIESEYSAVGSGDCLVAGLAAAKTRALSFEESAALACACGTANCLRPELGMLHRRDVESLLPQVRVRRLS